MSTTRTTAHSIEEMNARRALVQGIMEKVQALVQTAVEYPANRSIRDLAETDNAVEEAILAAISPHIAESAGEAPPMLDDEGVAMLINSPHYTAENIRAVIADLKACEQGTEAPEWVNRDHRGRCGVLWRVIAVLFHDVPVAAPGPKVREPLTEPLTVAELPTLEHWASLREELATRLIRDGAWSPCVNDVLNKIKRWIFRAPLSAELIENHIGPDEGDREAVTEIVRQVERLHGITAAKGKAS